MQEYLWDGIKRDRLVWIGDMHPEVSTIHAVFGFNDVIPRSLDLTRNVTPVHEWMNGISSYSMWWVLIHEDLWLHHGDRAYLEAQRSYLTALLERLADLVGIDGREHIDGTRFLDWPSSANPQGVTAGLQALLVMTLESGARLMTILGDANTAQRCSDAARRGRQVVPDVNGSKSGAALLVLAGMMEPREAADTILKVDGPTGISTFYGFYVLQALARSGDVETALDFIRTYWGAMLDLGATTFWEDFNLDWIDNAGRIDELVPPGRKDIHGDFGAYCYEGFRHSLCHGWASGPTAWLSQHVLGVTPVAPGFRRVRVAPQLGNLQWAEGTYPTPLGIIRVRHERRPDGTISSRVEAPEGITVEDRRHEPRTRKSIDGQRKDETPRPQSVEPRGHVSARLWAVCVGFVLLVFFVPAAGSVPADMPNVVIFLIDDLGRMDLGIDGSPFHDTPRMNALARAGVRFTDFYAAHPVCSPTRAALMTGKVPQRVGITDWIHPQSGVALPAAERTLAEAFQSHGYQTAYVGKWHLGEADVDHPSRHGFEWTLGVNRAGQPASYYFPYRRAEGRSTVYDVPDFKDGKPGDYLTDAITDGVIAFMKQRDRQRPFFICFGHYAVHTPIQPPRGVQQEIPGQTRHPLR